MSNFELFRFVDVHSPDYLSRDNNPFTTSFNDLISSGGTSSLVNDIKDALDPENETPIEDINALVDTFVGGTSYYASEAAVNTATSNTLTALKLIQELSPFDKEEAKTILQDTISSTILTNITSTTIRDLRIKVWNNLIVEIIRPTSILLKDALINALRVYRVIEIILLDESTELEIKKAMRAFPLLPEGIFKLPYRQTPPEEPTPDDSPTVEETNLALQEKMNKLKGVYIEINAQREELIRVAGATESLFNPEFDSEGNLLNPEEAPAAPDYYKFTNERKDLLSEDVDEVLTDLKLSNEIGRTYDEALNRIKLEKKNTFEAIFSTGKKYQKSIFSEGILFSIEGFGDPDDPDLGGGGIYPEPEPVIPCQIKPVGVGEYRKVEQSWERYEPGEIAHIENVMQTELRDRETRHLRRKEETLTIETVREEEVLRDLQTTERFSLVNETSKIIAKELETDLAANINGKYGVTNFSVDTGISYGYSSQVSQFNSTEYAKEVIEKASKRVTERFREERIVKVLEEFEEKNKHTFDNIDGSSHVVGIYRWLNLVYQCKLLNYGRRLTFEFSIPEPGAFHIYAKSFNPADSITLEKPIHPRDGVNIPGLGLVYLNSADDLDDSNFLAWSAAFDAKVDPYPILKSISKGYAKTSFGYSAETANDLTVPEGYYAYSGGVKCQFQSDNGCWATVVTNMGGCWFVNNAMPVYMLTINELYLVEGTVAVSIISNTRYVANVDLLCVPKTETIQKWKIDTYNAIMDAYEKKRMAYENALQQVQVQQELQIQGSNPALYRQIEMKALKKGSIQLLNAGYWNLLTGYNNFYDQFNAMKYKGDYGYPGSPPNPFGYPEFDNCDAIAEGHVLSFFEKVFDWDIMSYKFFPYFWGQKKRWKMLYNLEDNDPLFTNFLQAGYAKVLIPVKPGYEEAAIQFLETGQLWNGGQIAGADVDNFSALTMINNFYNPLPGNNGEPIEEHVWETSVPTNLVILQEPGVNLTDGPGLPVNAGN